MRVRLFIIGMTLFVLAACRPEPKPVSPLDINPTKVAMQTASAMSATMIPTTTPEPGITSTQTQVTLPTVAPTIALEYPDFFATTVYPGSWSDTAFIDAGGDNHTFEEFLGKGVIIQVMSVNCRPCPEQTEMMRTVAERRASFQDTENLVFIILSVVSSDSREALAEYTAQYGTDNSTINWMAALGSPDLLLALSEYFGEDVVNPHGTTILVIDRLGLGHRINQEGAVGERLLEDAVVFVATDPALLKE